MMTNPHLIEETTKIVEAYVGRNTIDPGKLSVLIHETHAALSAAASSQEAPAKVEQTPAVPVKKSLTPDYIICLEDGKKFKSLKRHLRTQYGMSPDEYREKWRLPGDYPMVAPNYAVERSHLAKKMGLGVRKGAA